MRTIRLLSLIFCLWLLHCSQEMAFAGDLIKTEYGYKQYTVVDGLPENMCWRLFQDSKGYIWIGTYDGFACYDGQKFKSYWDKGRSNVLKVTETASGKICALAASNIAVLDRKSDTLSISPRNEQWKLMLYTAKNMPPGYSFYETPAKDRRALFAISDTGLVKVWEHKSLLKMDEFRKPYWDTSNKSFLCLPTRASTLSARTVYCATVSIAAQSSAWCRSATTCGQ